MKLLKQKTQLKIHVNKKHIPPRHHTLLPNEIRCAVIGPSFCGKSSIVIGLLEHPNGVKFQNVYVCAKTLHQPEYQRLAKIIQSIPEMNFYGYMNIHEFPGYEDILPYSVCIFDDLGCDVGQNGIRNIFSYGRHKKLSS